MNISEAPPARNSSFWSQQYQLILAWLFYVISPSLLPQVTTYGMLYEVWRDLGEIFNAQSRPRIQLKDQLACFKKKDLLIDDYIPKLIVVAEEIRKVGIS